MPACCSSEEAACLRRLTATTSKHQGASPQGPAAYSQLIRRRDFRLQQRPPTQPKNKKVSRRSYIWTLLGSLIRLARKVVACSFLAPLVWFSCWLWLGWLAFRVPFAALTWLLSQMRRAARYRRSTAISSSGARRKCVLVSGGSSVQAVHLARNLSSSGARVIVCELEGLLGLARFSSACSRYYSLPRPGRCGAAAYVAALQDIVRRERCTHYVPVSASSPAYFDALAKPHLELMGCECFVPAAQELARLDDPLELLSRAERLGLATPGHRLIDSLDEAARLYEDGRLAAAHYALPAGPAGMRGRRPLTELTLPATLAEFRQRQQRMQSTRDQRWLVVREPAGAHYVTCTTLRDSRVLANVTCRVDNDRVLIADDRPEVLRWLERFFAAAERDSRVAVSGHLSFRLVGLDEKPGEFVAIGCRVGVPTAYLCHGSQQAGLILKRPCRHRQQQRPLRETYCMPNGKPKVLDKRETLFLIWDPLPYCVYCYLQLPLGRFYEALGARAGCASRGGAIV